MKDQTFTSRAADIPREAGDERCSRCGEAGTTNHTALWNHLEFHYCGNCMGPVAQ